MMKDNKISRTMHPVGETFTSNRNIALDLLKVIAVLLITNSHFSALYKDVNSGLATGGVPGDALFFFASGFALTLGKSAKGLYIGFIKNKLRRLLPTFIVWNIIASAMTFKDIAWDDFLLVPEYWFIQCIFIMYLLVFPFLHMSKKTFICLIVASVTIMFSAMLIAPYPDRSVYNDITLRYFCYLTPFFFGLYCGINDISIRAARKKYDGVISLLLFISYFALVSFGKCQENWRYYTEIFTLIPLNLFIFFAYRYFTSEKISAFVHNSKIAYTPVKFFSTLTLQIYVVQFYVITDKFNSIFPLSVLIIFSLILVWAYILNVCTKLFEQTLSKDPWDAKAMFRI